MTTNTNTNTNTNTDTADVPADVVDLFDQGEQIAWWVDGDHKGFSFEPDQAVGDAVAAVLSTEAATWEQLLVACQRLATADAASKLSASERATLASHVQVAWADRPGIVATMTGATYSKRCKIGRASPEQIEAFLLACADPTPNKFYEWLPKDAAMSKPRATKVSTPKVDPEPDADDAPAEPIAPTRWDAAHVATAARAMVAALRQQGADDVSIRLVVADAMRLMSPVSSVKPDAAAA